MSSLPPHPPLVSQLTSLLPDGSVDPASTTDCGWACCSAVLGGFRGVTLSPGCLRQAAGKPPSDGRSTPADLTSLLLRFRFGVSDPGIAVTYSQRRVRSALHRSRYALLLGYFQGAELLHWVLAYHPGQLQLWVMDPWTGTYRGLPWEVVEAEAAGPVILVGDRHGLR